MAARRSVRRNFDLFSSCSWYTPGIGGMFAVLGWLLAGMVAGMLLSVVIKMLLPGLPLCYTMLIIYPVQFIPVLIFVRLKSMNASMFETGFALDSDHYGTAGLWKMAALAVAAALGAAVMLDLVNHFLPDMDELLKETMSAVLDGPLWVSLLSMSIMAPLFEEWLCRGVVLRGLLNCSRLDKEGNRVRGLHPAPAIVISAFFFAAIHGNFWQGIAAFMIGLLMGYVYYRTGSLKLTMLMHCTNNTLSVLLAKLGGEAAKDAGSLLDLMPAGKYAILFAAGAVFVAAFLLALKDVPLERPQGNSDVIPTDDGTAEAEPA
ncbi:MAG: CPBP family intramembrane metalloprotease [Bacteroidales bacterium]|nr:CPBP family intramembrane metalloprotease [Bacteroidales bacterium]